MDGIDDTSFAERLGRLFYPGKHIPNDCPMALLSRISFAYNHRPSFERQTKGVTKSDRMRDLFPLADEDIFPVVHKHSRKDSELNGRLSSAPAI